MDECVMPNNKEPTNEGKLPRRSIVCLLRHRCVLQR